MKIAKTEVNCIINFALWANALERGFTKKYWVCLSDSNTRDGHCDLNAKSLNILDKWPGNLYFPSDPAGEANMVINCRCFQIFE